MVSINEVLYGNKYRGMPTNAKLIYIMLTFEYEKQADSDEYKRFDKFGFPFVYYPCVKLAEKSGISISKIRFAMMQLKKWGLVKSVYWGKPYWIYYFIEDVKDSKTIRDGFRKAGIPKKGI